MNDDTLKAGLAVQKDMFGSGLAEDALQKASPFMQPFQELMTRYCFGEVWTRPGLGRRERSLATLSMLLAQGRAWEIQIHTRGALANGVTREEIRELFIHGMIYCGVPNAVGAFRSADEVLKQIDDEDARRST